MTDKDEIDEIFDSLPGETWELGKKSEAVKDVVNRLKYCQKARLIYDDEEKEEYQYWIKTLLWLVDDS